MPDISMCTTKDCPLQDTCYRKTAKPSMTQSFMNFELSLDRNKKECENYYRKLNTTYFSLNQYKQKGI